MPRCYTIKKINAQKQSTQHYCSNYVRVDDASSSDYDDNYAFRNVDGEKRLRKSIRKKCVNKPKNSNTKTICKNRMTGRNIGRRSAKNNSVPTSGTILSTNGCDSDWKTTVVQRKHLPVAVVQQKCKDEDSGPTSPNEATVAPVYSKSNAYESKTDCLLISLESRNKTHAANARVSNGGTRDYIPEQAPMSIILTDTSKVAKEAEKSKSKTTSPKLNAAAATTVYKPYRNIIPLPEKNTPSGDYVVFNVVPSTKIATTQTKAAIVEATPSSSPGKNQHQNNRVRERNYNHSKEKHHDYYESSSSIPASSSIEFSGLSLNKNSSLYTNASISSIYRERSIEETEAAHDLLSLSQSLPPLPAPCVVTILHPVTNYNVSSMDVHEITPSKDYVTYISNDSSQNVNGKYVFKSDNFTKKNSKARNENTLLEMDHSTIFPANVNLNPTSSNKQKIQEAKSRLTPLTPPTSESSSSDIEFNFITEPVTNGRSKTTPQSSRTSLSKYAGQSKRKETKSAQVIGMTIFDAVMINDGRTKKGNGDAEIIHVEEKRKGHYKCPQCGKQYATSSNLSRHKQTHRSLDSQSAKKCNTCGKAYVSMPALAMHLLTHKLTHSCDVCGKLFSRPWLLQGHLRSHTGEKPYGCAHCGKAFADRSNLRAHMQTHSINKQFECTRCRKSFALKSYLNKHLESSCLRDEFKKFYDSNEASGHHDSAEEEMYSSSMDDNTIDVTDATAVTHVMLTDDGDDDDDIIVT